MDTGLMVQRFADFLPAFGLEAQLPGMLAFCGVLLAVVGTAGLFGGVDPIRRRLTLSPERSSALELRPDAQERQVRRLEAFLAPRDARTRTRLRHWLGQAGYRRPGAVALYVLARIALAAAPTLAIAALFPVLSRDFDAARLFVLAAALGLAGFYLPMFLVVRRIQYRREAIRKAFPDALDLLLVCVEAGQGLDAALAKVAAEVGNAHPALAEELLLVGLELRAGRSRRDVLRSLADRVGVDEVSAFVTVLIQSDEFGTSIADALRVYAAEMRGRRLITAEEQANKLPVKLALGTMAFTVPPVMLILAGPSVIMVLRTLASVVR